MAKDVLYCTGLKQNANLSASELGSLNSNLANMIDQYGSVVTYGTMFSGSDLVNGALQALTRVWSEMYGREVEFQHLFLIEQHAWKRELCAAHWQCQHAFDDVIQLQENGWVGYDEKMKASIAVLEVEVNIAGFECDSISSCNQNRADNEDCIEKGEDQTGSTAQALLSFTLLRRPGVSWWENVKQLRGKHLAWLTAWCVLHGSILVPNILAATLYGAVCRRDRQWMLVIDVMCDDVPVSPEVQQAWALRIENFNSCLGHLTVEQPDLSTLLLPADDLQLLEWQATSMKRRLELEAAKAKAK